MTNFGLTRRARPHKSLAAFRHPGSPISRVWEWGWLASAVAVSSDGNFVVLCDRFRGFGLNRGEEGYSILGDARTELAVMAPGQTHAGLRSLDDVQRHRAKHLQPAVVRVDSIAPASDGRPKFSSDDLPASQPACQSTKF